MPGHGCENKEPRKDYYAILNLPKNAPPEDIKRSYRKSALALHPDKVKGANAADAESKSQEISEAYSVLGDKGKRALYDHYEYRDQAEDCDAVRSVEDEERMLDAFFGASGNPFRNFGFGTMPPGTGGGGENRAGPGEPPPPPVRKKLECTLEELYAGCRKRIRVTEGRIGEGGDVVASDTHDDGGGGILTVDVRPGTAGGTKITVARRRRRCGALGGNIIFEICASHHHIFTRERNDLVHVADVSLQDALSGFIISVRSLGGEKIRIKCPKLRTSKDEQRIRGKGMPLSGSKDKTGDMIFRFVVRFGDDC